MMHYPRWKAAFFAAVALGVGATTCLFPAAAADKPRPAQPKFSLSKLAAALEPSRTLVYKTVGDRQLLLHVFDPPGKRPGDCRPAFIAIHGGGWVGGDARRFYPFAAEMAKRGMVGISVEYRLINKPPGTTPFDCVKDGRSAVRWVRAHAAELGIDPEKIAVSGGSAGGHVAAGTALFDGVDEPTDDLSVSPVPNALVLYFPVIDTSEEGYGNAKCGPRWKEISPVHRVKPGAPPTIIFHGTADTTCPFKGAKAFQKAMAAAGNRCELVVGEGGKHGYLLREQKLFEETLKKTADFLTQVGILGAPPSGPAARK